MAIKELEEQLKNISDYYHITDSKILEALKDAYFLGVNSTNKQKSK